jgi:peptide chain release factor 3
VHLFERVKGGAYRAPVQVTGLEDPSVQAALDAHTYGEVREQLEVLDVAGHPFDLAAVHAGKLTPVFFGSAVNNFGVQLMLDNFLRYSVGPAPRVVDGETLPIDGEKFAGFIFKIQANMDPKHRDRIAFLRVCAGRFSRDMLARHSRTGKTIRLSNSHKLFAQERETANEAFPGDILGLVGHNEFGIGDTLTDDPKIVFNEIPRFPPECFAYLFNPSPADSKKYRGGLDQLLQEGVVQTFTVRNAPTGAAFLAAVGPLQFEVVQYRLQSEYGAESKLEAAPFAFLKWLAPHPQLADPASIIAASGVSFGTDKNGDPCVLFPNEWTMNYFKEKNPELTLLDLPDDPAFHRPG